MARVSVVIASRLEKYLPETLEDLYEKRGGQIEVIVVLDGPHPPYDIPEYPRLKIIEHKKVRGMRDCLNEAVQAATGKYIMKIDAHSIVCPNYDKILQSDCEDNWIVVPKRYWFDAPTWSIIEDKEPCEAMYFIYPFKRPYRPYITGRPWAWRAEENRKNGVRLFEDMAFQGSLWFMERKHFHRIGGFDTKLYGLFNQEPEEIGLKTVLGPWEGKLMRNLNAWHAHWGKPQSHQRKPHMEAGRVSKKAFARTALFSFNYWWNDLWDEQTHNFKWLVDKFWEINPLPGWPENWRWLSTQYDRYSIPVPETGYSAPGE